MHANHHPALHGIDQVFRLFFLFCVCVAGVGFATGSRADDVEEVSFRTPTSQWEVSWLNELYADAFEAETAEPINWSSPPFQTAIRDLDGKPGNAAIFVSWTDTRFCTASACQLDVWYWDAPEAIDKGVYRKVLQGIALQPLTLGPQRQRGMRDVWVGEIRYRWTGSRYEK